LCPGHGPFLLGSPFVLALPLRRREEYEVISPRTRPECHPMIAPSGSFPDRQRLYLAFRVHLAHNVGVKKLTIVQATHPELRQFTGPRSSSVPIYKIGGGYPQGEFISAS
jgi:hypothetical protein